MQYHLTEGDRADQKNLLADGEITMTGDTHEDYELLLLCVDNGDYRYSVTLSHNELANAARAHNRFAYAPMGCGGF
jgi:hypothetical protein